LYGNSSSKPTKFTFNEDGGVAAADIESFICSALARFHVAEAEYDTTAEYGWKGGITVGRLTEPIMVY
jgi:hypothetical protein